MKEFEWFEWFEWFGPSPIEPFNSGEDARKLRRDVRPHEVNLFHELRDQDVRGAELGDHALVPMFGLTQLSNYI